MEPDTPEVEDIADFIREHELKMHVLLAHQNPYHPQPIADLVHWSCKIINEQGNWIVVYFSKGLKYRVWIPVPESILNHIPPIHVPLGKTGKPYDGPMPPFESKENELIFNQCSAPEIPNLREVLTCVTNDVSLVEKSGMFEVWCNHMKASPDSRQAKAAWDVVVRQRLELQALLGEGPFYQLVYETER